MAQKALFLHLEMYSLFHSLPFQKADVNESVSNYFMAFCTGGKHVHRTKLVIKFHLLEMGSSKTKPTIDRPFYLNQPWG